MQKMAELIEQGGAAHQDSYFRTSDMKKIRNITESLVKINSIENQADDVLIWALSGFLIPNRMQNQLLRKRYLSGNGSNYR